MSTNTVNKDYHNKLDMYTGIVLCKLRSVYSLPSPSIFHNNDNEADSSGGGSVTGFNVVSDVSGG